jgi:thiocyanate desulfurase
LAYLEAKRAREEENRTEETARGQPDSAPDKMAGASPSKLDRRSFLTVVAGTAAVGEAAALGHMIIKDQTIPAHGFRHAGESYTEAQRHNIERELINPKADIGGRGFGKLGGGTYAVDLNTGRALAWISYWTYGDFNPISHHLCAFPSADPVQGFEWVNSTQGGKNSLIYGIPTNIETPADGFNIYRVRFDGSQMELMENVSETTGLGLGVHVTIDPKTAERYFVADGQKDIAACFDRRTSRVITALKSHHLRFRPANRKRLPPRKTASRVKADCPRGQGCGNNLAPEQLLRRSGWSVRVCERRQEHRLGTKGQKIEWEMVPMGELFVEEGTIPGDDPHHLSGADGTIWHPSGRWAATVVRLCGGTVILDAENDFEPVAFLQFNKDAPHQYPVVKIDDDHWQITFDKIFSPGHEIGFSPNGRFFCMMNNLRENNCSVFDSSDPDPRNWKKIAHIEDPLWRGKYPNPFHMVFSMTAQNSICRSFIPPWRRAGSWLSTPRPG